MTTSSANALELVFGAVNASQDVLVAHSGRPQRPQLLEPLIDVSSPERRPNRLLGKRGDVDARFLRFAGKSIREIDTDPSHAHIIRITMPATTLFE